MAHANNFEQKLTEILVKNKAISAQQAQELTQSFKKEDPETFEDYLLNSGLINKATLLKALSNYYQLPAFDVSGYLFEHDLLKEFPKDVMLRNRFIPVEADQDILIVVASMPSDDLAVIIEKYVNNDVQFNVGLRRDIEDAVKEFYDESILDEPSEDPYYKTEEDTERIEKILEDERKQE